MALFKNNDFQYKENKVFSDLKRQIEDLELVELRNNSLANLEEKGYSSSLKSIHQNLDELTVIHLKLGREKVIRGEKAIKTINLFTRMEIIFLVVLAILLQIIVLYRPKK